MRLEVIAHREGNVTARLADGESCQGAFNTVPDEIDSWDDAQQSSSVPEMTQLGVLVLVCPRGLVLRCDFSRAWEGDGSGLCTDRTGQRYGLVL